LNSNFTFSTSQNLGRTFISETGEEWLYFGGTSYLGLSNHPDFQLLVKEGIQKYGLHYGSSRISNLRLKVYAETEDFLAQKMNVPKVLTFSSGYMAGQAVTQWLKKKYPHTPLFYAPDTHPAVKNLETNILNLEVDFEKWLSEKIIKINHSTEEEFILVMDSVDSLRGQTRNFDVLEKLNSNKKLLLVVDDSHGFGILGNMGEGIVSHLPNLPNLSKVIVSSLGKAGGIPAGFIAGESEFITEIQELSIFRGASPALPSFLEAFRKAEHLRQHQLKILRQNIHFFSQALQEKGLDLFLFSKNYPIFYAQRNDLASMLLPQKILLWHFAYSSNSPQKHTRIVLNATHQKADLEKLLTHLEKIKH